MSSEKLRKQIKERAFEKGEFILASGRKSNYYINIKNAYTEPEVLRNIAKDIAEKLSEIEYNLIAGVAVGAVPIVTAVALEVNKPFLIVRKERKNYGTGMNIEGEFSKGERVVVLEDVTTTGGSVIKAIKELREKGLECSTAIVVVDREEGAGENLKKEEVKLISLMEVNELMRDEVNLNGWYVFISSQRSWCTSCIYRPAWRIWKYSRYYDGSWP